MKIRLIFATACAKLAVIGLRLFKHGGTTLPGKIALKIYPDIGTALAKNFNIIMVTGTNGKTTTTKIISKILDENNIRYVTNKSGANLVGGIITTLIEAVGLTGKSASNTALLEIDEAAFNKITHYIKPHVLVVTNFFRDQLDRYGELYTTLNGVKEGLKRCPDTRIILNADDSLCASIGNEAPNSAFYFGFEDTAYEGKAETTNSDAMFCIYCKEKYTYHSHIYGHLGSFECPGCGYKRPAMNLSCTSVDKLTTSSSEITYKIESENVQKYTAKVNLPGLYNVYNGLAAASCATLLNLPQENTLKALSSFESGFGRMETIKAGDKTIKLILVKNPTGFNQVINFLTTEEKNMSITFIINDNLADGTDISWLWDVEFENLSEIEGRVNTFYTSGIRGEDMSVRLKYAGLPAEKISLCHDYNELLTQALDSVEDGSSLYILPTYTAMLDIRSILANKFGLKEFWK